MPFAQGQPRWAPEEEEGPQGQDQGQGQGQGGVEGEEEGEEEGGVRHSKDGHGHALCQCRPPRLAYFGFASRPASLAHARFCSRCAPKDARASGDVVCLQNPCLCRYTQRSIRDAATGEPRFCKRCPGRPPIQRKRTRAAVVEEGTDAGEGEGGAEGRRKRPMPPSRPRCQCDPPRMAYFAPADAVAAAEARGGALHELAQWCTACLDGARRLRGEIVCVQNPCECRYGQRQILDPATGERRWCSRCPGAVRKGTRKRIVDLGIVDGVRVRRNEDGHYLCQCEAAKLATFAPAGHGVGAARWCLACVQPQARELGTVRCVRNGCQCGRATASVKDAHGKARFCPRCRMT